MTLDASVLVRSSTPGEAGKDDCDRALLILGERHVPLIMPTLILVELAGALSRRGLDRPRIERLLERVRTIPASLFLPLDESLAEEAAALAVKQGLRGADAVYVATARRGDSTLLTVDEEQRARVPVDVTAMLPTEFLATFDSD